MRDELLGLHPTDYDVATDATPQRIAELFPRTAEVGASFGVVLVRSRGVSVEVATFRSDGPYSDRRRPDSVHFSDPRSDALRRDFTINALFLDPLHDEMTGQGFAGAARPGPSMLSGSTRGRVIDFVNGQADLRDRVLRAVGDPNLRLAEDHLRALRAVRFAARLDFAIDPSTAVALRHHARELAGVSRERVGEELRRMLVDARRAHAVMLLQSLGLDAPVLQEESSQTPPTLVAALGTNAGDHPLQFPTVLAAWALDRGLACSPPDPAARKGASVSPTHALVARWRAALCLSNDDSDQLGRTLDTLGAIEHGWATLGIAARKRLAATRVFSESMNIFRGRDPALAARVDADVRELAATPGGLAPEPLVTGDVLIAAGFRPSPAFKALLDRVYDAQLEGKVSTVADGLALAFQITKNPVN